MLKVKRGKRKKRNIYLIKRKERVIGFFDESQKREYKGHAI